ncbi:DNL-type zinc finger protein-like isoform X1 [Zingiber officinale]|uniref:DNL-type zinc finger protein-like isoform X1 n=1 Tax=Zingiber officinale TaxID=94328 RepID=UPI001C4D5531|nr:DNL-type zinc finger protein-like isoform X1 [Zingiber officinale]
MSAAAPVASAPACPFLIPTQLGRRAPIGLQAPGQTHRVHRLRVQHSALPCRLLRLHRPNSRIFLLSCAAGDAAASESLPGSSSPQEIKLPRRNLLVEFTCDSCGERTRRLINRVAYEKGTIFLQCGGCLVYHKFVDNLGLVVEYDMREDSGSDSDQ